MTLSDFKQPVEMLSLKKYIPICQKNNKNSNQTLKTKINQSKLS